MRALAVLVVLLFHLDVAVFAQGYLGVDLFFVISGFIITRNIAFDLSRNIFSPHEFYYRRFRRLFPALIVTVLLTLLAAMAIMPPVELAATGKSALYALASLANFNFLWEADYFDAAAHTKPLLHTWSLSVEEQFYLLWPAILLFARTNRVRFFLSALLLALSLAASLMLRDTNPSEVFYMLPFRVHQLMAGAAIALIGIQFHARLAGIGCVVGTMVFLALCVPLFQQYSPAVNAVGISLLGIVLLCARESKFSQIVYGNGVMQWIGKRSYAIYLVHWPLIVLFKFSNGFELSVGDQILLFAASIGLAILLHEGVEKPFRKRGVDQTRVQKMATPASLIVLFFTLFIAANFWGLAGMPDRADSKIRNTVGTVAHEIDVRREAIRFNQCNLYTDSKLSDYNAETCAVIVPNKKNVLIIGDSLAADTYMMLSQTYNKNRIHFSQATASACMGMMDLRAGSPVCEEFNHYRFSELVRLEWDAIVLASRWVPANMKRLTETVQKLHDDDKKVLLFGPRPEFNVAVPLYVSMQSSLDFASESIQSEARLQRDVLQLMRDNLPGVAVVDMAAVQCATTCEILQGVELLYYDQFHFTKLGAKIFGQNLMQEFNLWQFLDQEHQAVPPSVQEQGTLSSF